MTYVLSDIHGNLRRFKSILKQIDLKPSDTLYVLGDVIDRHPSGLQILYQIMGMPNAKMLLGNHEYMMLRFLGDPYDGPDDILHEETDKLKALWYRNGGGVTHKSWIHTRINKRVEIIDYLKSLPLNIDITVGGKGYKLVHGAPLELYDQWGDIRETKTHFTVWNRESMCYGAIGGEQTVIFGHTPTDEFQGGNILRIWYGEHRIGIDCGCSYSDGTCGEYGRLGCLRLDDMKEFYSEEPQLA